MTLTRSFFFSVFTHISTTFFLLAIFVGNLYAGSLQSGLNQSGENAEALRSYGGYLIILVVGLIAFLVISRGREIRRQHPKAFH